MLTFPEYGIYGIRMSRKRMSLFAETIPDPKISHRYPCIDPEFKGQSTEVQRLLSCIARDNEMFLVINMAGREICDRKVECPPDGQYLFNTNVVFSPEGELVARYYKRHLFQEDWFNPAKSNRVAIFNTPFGKFATFICFDVVFKKPAVEIIEKYNIRNIAYSVAWVSVPPLFRSVQMHSSFARGANVNLLAANLHWLPSSSYGSGIYTPTGAAAYYYRPNVPGSKLVIADIYPINNAKSDIAEIYNYSQKTETEKNDTILNVEDAINILKFKHLKNNSGSITVCYKSFCCKASYTIKRSFQEIYALGVYSGYWNVAQNKLYSQICTLLKCPSSKCGEEITHARTVFSHLSLQGTGFSTKYVYPSTLAMDKKGDYVLVPNAWTYSRRKGIRTRPGKTITLHSTNLVGRVYSRDIIVRDTLNHQNNESKNPITASIKYIFYLVAAYVLANL